MLWFQLCNKYPQFTWWSYIAHLPLCVIHFFPFNTLSLIHLSICPPPTWNILPTVDSFWSQRKYYCLSNLSVCPMPFALDHTRALLLIWNDHIQKAEALSAMFHFTPQACNKTWHISATQISCRWKNTNIYLSVLGYAFKKLGLLHTLFLK